jgi:hypothetical protein
LWVLVARSFSRALSEEEIEARIMAEVLTEITAQAETQTNKISGAATVSIGLGQMPTAMVGLNDGGTPNQKVEAAAVQVGAHCLLEPSPSGDAAVTRSIELLQKQLNEGHMWNEALTDSHAPIWLRAMTSLRWYSLKLRSRGGKFAQLEDLVVQWFEHHLAVLSLGLVPSGPLLGTVVLPCARKNKGTAGDAVRDAWLQKVTGAKITAKIGPNFWVFGQDRQDTASGPFTVMILKDGGFGDHFRRGTLPKLAGELRVVKFNDGHSATFPKGIPRAVDAATSCWVEYPTGKFSFKGDPGPFADRVRTGKVTDLPAV